MVGIVLVERKRLGFLDDLLTLDTLMQFHGLVIGEFLLALAMALRTKHAHVSDCFHRRSSLPLWVAAQFVELFAFVDLRVTRPTAEALRMVLLPFVQLVLNTCFDGVAAAFAPRGDTLVALLASEAFQRGVEVAAESTAAFGALEAVLMVRFVVEDRARFGSTEALRARCTAITKVRRCHLRVGL